MKKLFALLLALCLLCAAASAPAEEDYSGTWYLNRGEFSSYVVYFGENYDLIYDLKDDGTFTAWSNVQGTDATTSGTWTAGDGTITCSEADADSAFKEGDTVFTIEGDELRMENDSMDMVFTRTRREEFVLPDAVQAESVDQFNGTWLLTTAIQEGNVSVYSDPVSTIILQDGILFDFAVDDTGAETTSTYEGEFTDGSLTFILQESEEGTVDSIYTLLEDGSLCVSAEYYGFLIPDFYFIFTPAETAVPEN